jgi:hypothetical protein
MAKKRRKTATATRTQTKIIRMNAPRAAAPIVVRTSSTPARPKVHHRRRSHVGGSGGALSGKSIAGVVIGGALLGWIEKHYGAKLPVVPVLGVKGTIAIGAFFAHKQGFAREITRDICIAAAATSGYQLGKEGKVSGDVDGDDYVNGVAAQV